MFPAFDIVLFYQTKRDKSATNNASIRMDVILAAFPVIYL